MDAPWEARCACGMGPWSFAPSSPQRCTPFAVSEEKDGTSPGIPLLHIPPLCSRPWEAMPPRGFSGLTEMGP